MPAGGVPSGWRGGRGAFASAGGPLTAELARLGAEHTTLPLATKNPWRMRRNARRLAHLVEAAEVDLLHARSRAPAWSALWAARRTRRPFITTFHGTYNRLPLGLKDWYNAVMTKGDPVIAISEFIAEHMREVYHVPPGRIRVIHRGIDVDRFDPGAVSQERLIHLARQWRLPDDGQVVMLPGRLTRWKGQTVLLEAVARMAERHPGLRCLLVGSSQGRTAYRAELEDLARRLGIEGVVQIVEDCRDLPAAYMLTDCVVSASTDPEAFGRVAVEGQAMGRPVVATDHGGARETVIHGTTGLLVPPGDAEALARAVEAMLTLAPSERQTMAAHGREHARTRFSKARMCEQTLDVYAETLEAWWA